MDLIILSLAVRKALKELGVETEKKETCILAESVTSDLAGMEVALENPIVEGETYIVSVDGVKQKYVCKKNALGMEYLGDPTYMLDGDPTGDVFGLTSFGGTVATLATIDGKPHTIAITQETETIHPIDPKFLPSGSGGLPVVEVVSSGVPGLVSEEVNALLHEYAEQGTPIVAKLVVDGMGTVASSVLNYLKQNSHLMFTGDSPFDLATTDDGAWELRIS